MTRDAQTSPGPSAPRRARLLTASAVLLATLTVWGTAHAGGFAITTFGSRRTGMLTNLGRVDEATAIFHNPAALADLKGTRTHISNSFSFLDFSFEMQALDAERYPELWTCPVPGTCDWPITDEGYYQEKMKPEETFGMLPYLGFAYNLADSGLENVTVSGALTAPNVYVGKQSPTAPAAYSVISGHLIVISTMAGVGWRINDYVAIGGTVMHNYMDLGIAQRYSMADMMYGNDMADLAQAAIGDLRMDFRGSQHGIGGIASILIDPTPWLSIGLAYNDATDPKVRGDLELTQVRGILDREALDDAAARIGYRLPVELIVEMPIPPYYSGGFNFHPSDKYELGFDLRIWRYDVYEKQVLKPIYDTEEGIAPMTEESLTRPKDYTVSWDVSLGFLTRPFPKYKHLQITAGAGYDKSPVPDKRFTIDSPSLDNWRVATGVRWAPPSGWQLSLTYTYMGYLLREVTTSETSPPLNGRALGSNQFPRVELEYVF